MLRSIRSKKIRGMLVPILLSFLLALLGLSVAVAQGPGAGPPGGPPDTMNPTPTPDMMPEPTATPDTMMPQPTATPDTSGPSNPGGPTTGPGGPGDPTGPITDPDTGNGGDMMRVIRTSNRIVMHAAAPVNLIKTGDGGLHLYFIGADGSTFTGPTFSSFATLEEMHPSGAAVSLFDGSNPSTGQPVTVDYLPDENRIFVKTFYPAGHDKHNPHKAYDFTVDDKYKVKHVNW